MNIYLQLTDEFNAGGLRAIICSGQAAVLHQVAIMSKDGDWILREDQECLGHILEVLEQHGAHYRFGAPLDTRWLAQGWSAHFEFPCGAIRVRTDFFTRPPRLNELELKALWEEQSASHPPFVNLSQLARMKQTDREKDYVIIGELARRMRDPADQIRYSRSALDLMRLKERHPALFDRLAGERPALQAVKEGRARLEAALDAERRELIHLNEERLSRYEAASGLWMKRWPKLAEQIQPLPLRKAHRIVAQEAETHLPMQTS
ncbi:MAG: hypothetical protein PHP98_04090 [Kiritimatiellae bacterium]|nr:hypothetical protein [Kiritimatiellia bacterium]